MIDLRNKETNKITHHYECTTKACVELCFANIECLLHIALADSDAHIKALGGEQELLNLMNGYLDFASRLEKYNKTRKDFRENIKTPIEQPVNALNTTG